MKSYTPQLTGDSSKHPTSSFSDPTSKEHRSNQPDWPHTPSSSNIKSSPKPLLPSDPSSSISYPRHHDKQAATIEFGPDSEIESNVDDDDMEGVGEEEDLDYDVEEERKRNSVEIPP